MRSTRLVRAFDRVIRIARIANVAFLGAELLALAATFVWADPLLAHLTHRYGETGMAALIYLRLVLSFALPATYVLERILRALAEIIATLRIGDPFAARNTARLRTIGWALLALQLLDLLLGLSIWWAKSEHIRVLDWQPSFTGWLGVLVAFVLAQVFAQGAAMRDDLAGTV